MLGNISFAYNTWTHVAFQYNNQTKQQVRVFFFFQSGDEAAIHAIILFGYWLFAKWSEITHPY